MISEIKDENVKVGVSREEGGYPGMSASCNGLFYIFSQRGK